MTTDNRTNEPSDAQGVAATVALARSIHGSGADHEDFDYYRKHVDAALVAAAGAAPVQPSSTVDEDAEALAKYRSRQKQEATNYREWKRQNRGYGILELLTWAREAQDNVRFAAGWITHENYRRAVVPQNLIPLLERVLREEQGR